MSDIQHKDLLCLYCENDQHNKLLTSILSHSYNIFFFFGLCWELFFWGGGCTFKKDSFSNFQIYKILYILAIVLLAIVLLAIDMMYIISPGLIYLITVSLTTLTWFFQPYSPPPDARNHKFDLCFS